MAATVAIKTQGSTVSIGAATITTLTDITTPSDQYGEIDITNMASTKKEFLAGLADGGEFSFTWIVVGGAIESSPDIVACGVGGDAGTWAFDGYVKAAPAKAGVDGVWTQDVTVRCTGGDA